jgi:hypothetical protein
MKKCAYCVFQATFGAVGYELCKCRWAAQRGRREAEDVQPAAQEVT